MSREWPGFAARPP
jgi:hypothetical protein